MRCLKAILSRSDQTPEAMGSSAAKSKKGVALFMVIVSMMLINISLRLELDGLAFIGFYLSSVLNCRNPFG